MSRKWDHLKKHGEAVIFVGLLWLVMTVQFHATAFLAAVFPDKPIKTDQLWEPR